MIPPEFALLVGLLGTLIAFALFRGASALSLSFVVGVLFLPSAAAINFGGLPPIDRLRVIWLGALLGTLVFQPGALVKIRWHPADWLLLGTILLNGYSSIDNGLGTWDALSAMGSVILSSVLPYMLARIHFREAADLLQLTKVLFWGGVLYAPLAVWEFRMSPQFHNWLYGYFPHSWLQHVRWGFYRPVVFLGHGGGVAVFFSGCFLIGLVLLRRGQLKWRISAPVWLAVAAVGLGLLVGMTFSAWISVGIVWALFYYTRKRRWAPIVMGSVGFIWIACVFAGSSNWSWLTRPFVAIGATDRAASLQYRLDAMSEYAESIRTRPWFGHGRFGRGRIENRATDSIALIFMLTTGFVGAGFRYAWLFAILAAIGRAAQRTSSAVEHDLLLLYACMFALSITGGVLGVGTAYLPSTLVGGAVTGFASAGSLTTRFADRVRFARTPSYPLVQGRT